MSHRKLAEILITLLVVVGLFGIAVPATAAQSPNEGENGTTLTASVTAVAVWTIEYHWTIDKSVTPDTFNMFRGDSGTAQYTIAVNKDSGVVVHNITGQVCVTNGGAVATDGLAITLVLRDGVPPPNDVIGTYPQDLSSNPVLDPGESNCYDYVIDPPNPIHAGGEYKVDAAVTIMNHSGHLGVAFGPTPSASTTMPSVAVTVHDSITVNDTNGGSWQFESSGSNSYPATFTCDEDAGNHPNTATITYNDDQTEGPSDSAAVTVNCFALGVSKTADTALTRTWSWTIDKTSTISALTLSPGQEYVIPYSVSVDATSADSAWMVSGAITVNNPAPIPATINSVTDAISDVAGPVVVDCGVEFPYTLAAGGSLVCTYTADLPDASARTNTATATIQNTPSGTTGFTGDADVDFTDADITKVDDCITVTDDKQGLLGAVCAGVDDLPNVLTYNLTVGPYETCGPYTFTNTADFVTDDTGTPGSDSWTVDITVPCGGCTLTFGYWKTHSKYGPAPYDETWALVQPAGEDSPFFISGKTWYQVLQTAPKNGNVYYILAHQYEAAVLNQLNEAYVPPEVQTALASAEALFAEYTPAGPFSKQVKQQFTQLASLLDQYNNGLVGPGHCSEDQTSDKFSSLLKDLGFFNQMFMPLIKR